jgi:hypothetical protein
MIYSCFLCVYVQVYVHIELMTISITFVDITMMGLWKNKKKMMMLTEYDELPTSVGTCNHRWRDI